MNDNEQPIDSDAVQALGNEREEYDSGVELEQEEESETKIEHPFDPEKIKIRTQNIVVEQIVSRIRHDEIDLAPEFQRRPDIWDSKRQSRLIESLLLRIPLPVFYVAANRAENWSVVDGLQRMSAISGYVENKFALSRMEYLSHLEGKRHNRLPRAMQRRISETPLVVHVIEPGTPGEVMFNVFHRINTGGMELNGQEIRHALNPGFVREYLERLALSEEFLEATCYSIKEERMADRDCILRFLAFHINPWENYSVSDIDGYLDSAMKAINRMPADDRESLSVDFRKAMRAAADIFGDSAFRRASRMQGRRGRINKALFGAWSVGLARRSPKEIDILVRNRERVRETFTTLLEDDREFERAISSSTGTPNRVQKQFQAVQQLIEGVLRQCSNPCNLGISSASRI